MKQLQLLLMLVIMSTWAAAQNNFITPQDSLNTLVFNAYAGAGAPQLQQAFTNKFLFGGFINNDLKEQASSKLGISNIAGGQLKTDFNYLTVKKSNSSKIATILGMGAGYELFGGVKYSKDLFNLTFFGNSRYANETLILDDFNFNQTDFSFVEFSYGKQIQEANGFWNIWCDFGLVLGHSSSSFNFPTANVFTEQNGQYLDITINDGEIYLADTNTSGLFKGFGAKIDLHLNYVTATSNFIFSINNLGGINWGNGYKIDVDTTLRFDGYEVDDIFAINDSVLNAITNAESWSQSEKGDFVKALPITLNAYYQKNSNQYRWDILANYTINKTRHPYLRGGFNYKTKFIEPGVIAGFGGFAGFHTGVNADILLGSNFKIQLGTNNLISAISPNSSTMLDGYLGLRYAFN